VNLMRGEPVPVFGDGSQAVDLIWAPDVAECFARAVAMLPGEGELIDIGSGVERSVIDIARTCAELIGVEPTFERRPHRRGEGENYPVADTSAMVRYLDFEPPDRDDGIVRERLRGTIEWYREHVVNAPDEEPRAIATSDL